MFAARACAAATVDPREVAAFRFVERRPGCALRVAGGRLRGEADQTTRTRGFGTAWITHGECCPQPTHAGNPPRSRDPHTGVSPGQATSTPGTSRSHATPTPGTSRCQATPRGDLAAVRRPPRRVPARSGDAHAGYPPGQATPTPGTRQVRRPPRRVPARSGDPHAGNPAPRRGRSPIPCPAGGFVRRRQTSTAPAPVSPRAAFGTTRASPAALSLPLPARRVRIPRCPRCGRSLAGTPLAPAPGR